MFAPLSPDQIIAVALLAPMFAVALIWAIGNALQHRILRGEG